MARAMPAIEPNATLVDRDDLTPTMSRLRIRADDGPPPFRPGQYLAIGLPVDGRFVQRPYSVASSPGGTDEVEFLVRLVPGGSLTPRLWQLRPGDRVRLGPPKGLFMLDEGDPRQHLLVATGTGLAPLRSMLYALLARPARTTAASQRPPIVVHGVATAPELAYHDHLERLSGEGAILYVPAISRPTDPANRGWRGRAGRLDSLIAGIVADVRLEPASTVAYLCGNQAMVAALERQLASMGMQDTAIRGELYWTAPVTGRSQPPVPIHAVARSRSTGDTRRQSAYRRQRKPGRCIEGPPPTRCGSLSNATPIAYGRGNPQPKHSRAEADPAGGLANLVTNSTSD
jgi:ferredoxin--NADP+ reductase